MAAAAPVREAAASALAMAVRQRPKRRSDPQAAAPTAPKPVSAGAKHYEPGDVVEHKVFGRGRVVSVKAAAGDQIVEISFEKVGVKKTMANFAPLVKITTEE